MNLFPRIMGAATVAYSIVSITRPRLLAAPCELTDGDGELLPGTRPLILGMGARDVASGLAMMAAPAGAPLQGAIAVRVAADLGDALVFGTTLPSTKARRKVAVVATAWAALCALSALAAR